MFIKVYDKIKKFLKENIIEILILLNVAAISVLPLPYYIDMPGGLLDTKNRVTVEGQTDIKGSYNLAYVSEAKATPVLYLIALLNKKWDIVKEEDLTIPGQSIKELYIYERLLLEQASANAKIAAYNKAGKDISIKNEKLVIGYIDQNADTDLKVGDQLISIDGIKANSFSDIKDVLKDKKENDKVIIETLVDNKTVKKFAILKKIDNDIVIGISIFSSKEVETNPKCKLSFLNKESGPSGGLMTALTIYDYLVKEDLTKGLTVSGTGTIEEDGTVGEIGGVKYKLAGVVKEKADIFFVPSGENYEEAIKLKKENKYDIEIVSVSKLDDAINYLKNR